VKLAQNQVWKQRDGYLRIVHLERREVQYKAITNLLSGQGTHHHVSKKEFCQLIKSATLLTQTQVREIWLRASVDQPMAVAPGDPAQAPHN